MQNGFVMGTIQRRSGFMAGTLIKSYDSYAQAAFVVRELEAAGIPAEQISIVGRHDTIGTAAEAGGMIGSGAGLLGALIALPIPGVGPVLAAGWLIAGTALGAAGGAAAGTLMGVLTGAGLSDSDANTIAEMVRRGGALVAVRSSSGLAAIAEAIMRSGRPIDPEDRRAAYEREGWTRFDEKSNRSPADLSGVVS